MFAMFCNSKFDKNINKWFIKLNKQCNLNKFIKNENIKINSYNNFKKCHRQIILNKL